MPETLDLYPVVKAYPVVDEASRSEAVCVACVTATEPRKWIRLFPLDFRGLETAQQFTKYQRITVRASKARNDPRPESYTPELDSISIGQMMGTDAGTWFQRLKLFNPLVMESECELKRRQKLDGSSLGIFEPSDVTGLEITRVDERHSPSKQGLIDQQSFFDPQTRKLRKLPYKFKLGYRCTDSDCTGHNQSIIDWEIGALCLKLLGQGASAEQLEDAMRDKILDQMFASNRASMIISGNTLSHPGSFLVLGVVWPERSNQVVMF